MKKVFDTMGQTNFSEEFPKSTILGLPVHSALSEQKLYPNQRKWYQVRITWSSLRLLWATFSYFGIFLTYSLVTLTVCLFLLLDSTTFDHIRFLWPWSRNSEREWLSLNFSIIRTWPLARPSLTHLASQRSMLWAGQWRIRHWPLNV